MPGFSIRQFFGVVPRRDDLQLAPGYASQAVNCKLWRGNVQPWKANAPVITLTKPGEIQSIYRFAKQVGNDASGFWFHWSTPVDVARGIARSDTQERTYFTGDGAPKITDASIATAGGGTNYPTNSYLLGVPKPTTTPTAVATGTGDPTNVSQRAYIVTYKSAWSTIDEEGPPCDPTPIVSVEFGQDVTLSALPGAPGGNYNIAVKRIWRAAFDGNDAPYFLVAELPVATSSFVDNVLDENLGEVLSSAAYYPPEADMHSVVSLANGILVGASGNQVAVSEPYYAHAYDPLNQQPLNYPIVGIGGYESFAVVVTEEFPYLLSGSSPELMSLDELPLRQGCVSKRSIASGEFGVAYASPDGLVAIGPGGGFSVATAPYMTRDQWLALNPSSIHASVHDGKYVAFYDTGTVQGGFILDPANPEFGLTFLDWYASATYPDALADNLFLVVNDNEVVKWDSSATQNLSYIWESGPYRAPRPTCMTAAKIFADDYSDLNFTLLADKGKGKGSEVIYQEPVRSARPFRMPAGYRADLFKVRITGTSVVSRIDVTETSSELAGL